MRASYLFTLFAHFNASYHASLKMLINAHAYEPLAPKWSHASACSVIPAAPSIEPIPPGFSPDKPIIKSISGFIYRAAGRVTST